MEVNNSDLLVSARNHQRAARAQEADPSFAFLLTPDHEQTPFAHVTHLSGRTDKTDMLNALKDETKIGRSRPASEREALRVFSVQTPDRPTLRKVGRYNTSTLLPGGVPILDHLTARVQDSPDWSGLLPVLEDLRSSRLPEDKKSKSYRELTLGESSPRDWWEARQFMEHHIQRSKESSVAFFAADTESVQVLKTWDRDNRKESAEDSLLRHLQEEIESGHKIRSFTVIPEKYTRVQGTKVPMPVRFMVGGRDWEVHVRLPTHNEQAGEVVHMDLSLDTKISKEVREFWKAIPSAVGIDITKDYVTWSRFLNVLWEDAFFEEVAPPIELEHLARAARINDSSSSIFHLHWWVLGTLLPKDRASLGDGTWGFPLQDIAEPLRLYMSCDLEQVVKIATILAAVWAMQTFPDLTIVKDATLMDEVAFFKWVQVKAIPTLFAGWLEILKDRKGNWSSVTKPPQWQEVKTLPQLVEQLKPPTSATFSNVWEVPAWPSITCGGCRYLHQARAATVRMLKQLHTLDPLVWPDEEAANLKKQGFWLFNVPPHIAAQVCNNPVESLGLTARGNLRSQLPLNPFTWTIGEDLMPARQIHGASDRAIILLHLRLNPDGASEVLRFAEEQPMQFQKLLRKVRVVRVVRDIRNMLKFLNIPVHRPPGWKDPYKLDSYLDFVSQKREQHLKRKLEVYHRNQEHYATSIQMAEAVLQRGKRSQHFQSAYPSYLARAGTAAGPPEGKRRRVEETHRVIRFRDDSEAQPLTVDPERVASQAVAPVGPGGDAQSTPKVKAGQSERCEQAKSANMEMEDSPSASTQPQSASSVFPVSEDMLETVSNVMSLTDDTPIAMAMTFEMTVKDLRCLNDGECLTDAVVEGYFKLLQERSSQDGLPKVIAYGAFFYSYIVSHGTEHGARAQRGRDVFAADILLIPNHLGNHWCLTVVDVRSGDITVYDSFKSLGLSKDCASNVKKYLEHEHRRRRGTRLPSKFRVTEEPNVPQQVGGIDCGVFACRFAEAISRDGPLDFCQRDISHFRTLMKWELMSQTILLPGTLVEPLESMQASLAELALGEQLLDSVSDEDTEVLTMETNSVEYNEFVKKNLDE